MVIMGRCLITGSLNKLQRNTARLKWYIPALISMYSMHVNEPKIQPMICQCSANVQPPLISPSVCVDISAT